MFDGAPPEEPGEDEPSEEWREHERVDERYREPPEPDVGDIGPAVPDVPDPSENDVNPELSRRFWALVFVFNVALLALSLGAMFVVFEGNYSLGGQLVVGGLVALLFGLYRYRTTKRRLGEMTGEESSDENASPPEAEPPDEKQTTSRERTPGRDEQNG